MAATHTIFELPTIMESARRCAAEHIAQYEHDEIPDEWTGDMYDADFDYAGQMIGRPLDEYESNDFDAEFRRHFKALALGYRT